MITKSKTFYTSAMALNLLRKSEKTVISFSSFIQDEFNERVTISWEEEEPKISISESEFDELFKDSGFSTYNRITIKQKLFNKGE